MREKLIELLCKAHNAVTDKSLENDSEFGMTYAEQIETEADSLIENGVTIQKWIPVTERLPEKNMQCLCRYVFCDNDDYPFWQVLYYCSTCEVPHFQHEGTLGLRVTHWMPLPEAPNGERRTDGRS